jgi:putative tryptophan/tyrosine transport system substrate-binding protein
LIELRSAQADLERLPGLAAELVTMPVEIIVVSNDASAVAAAGATRTIPIVTAGGNPVGRVVTNIAHPEGNVTGVSQSTAGPAGIVKRIELLKETVPTISRLAGVSDESGTPALRDAAGPAAQALQVAFRLYDLRDLDQLSAVLATVLADGADGLVMLSGGTVGGGSDPRIGAAVLRSRLPAVAQNREFAVNGGLLAHGPNTAALARRAAAYVDKILKGAKPGDLPIELPNTSDVVVNLKTAASLATSVPQSVLAQATEIIQ